MPDSWNRRIDRATALARADSRASALLTQYAAILATQRTCYDALVADGARLTGSLDRDLPDVRMCAARAFSTVREFLPAGVAADAPPSDAAADAVLRYGWDATSPPFFARLVLQPYAEALAKLGLPPLGRNIHVTSGSAVCPFCGGPPQVSALRRDSGSDGGGRELICALCSTSWALRRILCVYCGEEDEHRLKYFHTPEFDHVRVDTCETCLRYLKAVDLTRLGIAVPVVDEVASGALDIWAHEHGFTKVEVNLVGL
jgi:FdhE protein